MMIICAWTVLPAQAHVIALEFKLNFILIFALKFKCDTMVLDKYVILEKNKTIQEGSGMKRRILSVTMAAIMFSILPQFQTAAETYSATNTVSYKGHECALYDDLYSWSEAKIICEDLGGHLVTITSEDEQKVIEKLMTQNSKRRSYWIGLYKDETWEWINGEEFNYTNWDDKEPNGTDSPMVGQIYSMANSSLKNGNRDFAWDDTWNEGDKGVGIKEQGFICEWDDTGYVSSNSTSEGAPIITSASLSYNGVTYDLFNQSHSVDKDSAEIMSVEAYVNTNGCEDVHVYITQGAGKSVEIPLNAYTDVKIGEEFSPGEPIYMLAVDNATGKSSSKRTKLSVTGTQMFEGGLLTEAIDLFDDFSVEIPESVPILGKEKIGLSLGSISVDAETDGNEFKVALGTDVFEHKLDSNGKWQEEAWQGLKEGFKEAKNSGLENSVRYLNAYGSETNLDISKGVSGKANVSGYLEGYFDENGGMHVSEGGVIVEGEIKYTYQGMVVVYVVPLYYEIGAGGGLEFVGGVRDLVSGGGLQGAFTGSLTPSISFEAGGGVGVPKVFTAGVSGKVKAELEIALDKIYQKLDVTGSAAFKLTGPFGIPTYPKEFAKGTFNIYETGNPDTLLGKVGLYSEEYDVNNLYAGIDIDSPIGTAPHDDSVQKWVGDKEQVQLMADYTNQTVQVLEEDSYENIAPAFAQMDGKNVIAWITDNKNRPDEDKTMLVYSVFENGVWSAPQAVCDDGLADYSPVMRDGYIVWQKATDHISADMTSRELGEICEIYLAKWNGSGFDEPICVTENSLIDQTPVLAVNNGEPTVVWVQNSANDFTGLTGENRIMSYKNGETTIAVTEENVVTYIDCAYIDGELDIAYETDGDKDLYTIDDREIYTVSKGQITSNELPDTHPVYADFNGETVLFYYSNGSIVYIENDTEKTVMNGTASTDQFTVVSNGGSAAVLWTAVSDGSAEIHGSLYDDTMWSEDVIISDLGQRIKYPSAVMNADGSIFAAFNRTEKVSDGGDYYIDGQSDLCTINIVPSYDLEIADAYFDEAAMTAYATVKNIGELSISGFNITLTDSDVVFVTDELKAGTSVDVEIPYSVPDDMSLRTVALGVELIEGEEYNIENNTAEF